MEHVDGRSLPHLEELRNIILKGADPVTAKGFTMLPNFLLKSRKLSAGDKMAFAMLLSYAWQNDYCFPGQARLADDMGLDERSVRRHLKSLETNDLLTDQAPRPRQNKHLRAEPDATAVMSRC
jgi:hypothetical protein